LVEGHFGFRSCHLREEGRERLDEVKKTDYSCVLVAADQLKGLWKHRRSIACDRVFEHSRPLIVVTSQLGRGIRDQKERGKKRSWLKSQLKERKGLLKGREKRN
jgi:hypothetical protein